MVTASWRTAERAMVTKEISPMKRLVPRFSRIIMPMEARKMRGMRKSSRKMNMVMIERVAAMAT